MAERAALPLAECSEHAEGDRGTAQSGRNGPVVEVQGSGALVIDIDDAGDALPASASRGRHEGVVPDEV
jgi:hypothetical protein